MFRLITLAVALAACFGSAHCGDVISSDTCRLEPQLCGGGAGTICNDDRDCNGGLICCTAKSNCAGGMCTLACKDDRDCPADMACEHDVCFYRCETDRDCAPGMTCEHGNTICEYP
ncbi:MAG: hypothetical protein KC503_42670 [Myxococcales bacterium]|nr:hypothetical protein [Myxococcales bacterium]